MARNPYKQGVYTPEHNNKYRGSTPIFYRSGLELRFMRWCDRNDNVVSWGSESVVIPYISPLDGKPHKYFIDFILALKTPTGVAKYIVELKPHKQTFPPGPAGKKKPSTIFHEQVEWAKNSQKWLSAKAWAEKNNIKFMILTEKDL